MESIYHCSADWVRCTGLYEESTQLTSRQPRELRPASSRVFRRLSAGDSPPVHLGEVTSDAASDARMQELCSRVQEGSIRSKASSRGGFLEITPVVIPPALDACSSANAGRIKIPHQVSSSQYIQSLLSVGRLPSIQGSPNPDVDSPEPNAFQRVRQYRSPLSVHLPPKQSVSEIVSLEVFPSPSTLPLQLTDRPRPVASLAQQSVTENRLARRAK
jgi:hypothetical protein